MTEPAAEVAPEGSPPANPDSPGDNEIAPGLSAEEIADAVVAKQQAEGTGQYGPLPANLKWVPVFGVKEIRIAFGIAGGVALVLLLILGMSFGKKAFAAFEYHQQLSLVFAGIAVILLCMSVPLMMGDVARLEEVRNRPPEAEPGHHRYRADAGESVSGVPLVDKETIEAIAALVGRLTPGRVLAATGILVLFTSALLAYSFDPSKADDGGESTDTTTTPATPSDGAPSDASQTTPANPELGVTTSTSTDGTAGGDEN